MTTEWEHVHQCAACGHAIRIDELDLRVISTGVITCPKCERSGPINVKIVKEELLMGARSASDGNRE